MAKNHKIDTFTSRFENLVIDINEINIEYYLSTKDLVLPEGTAYSCVSKDTSTNIYSISNDKFLNGKVFMWLKSQAANDDSGMFLTVDLNVRGIGERYDASIFCKSVNYLFDWVTKYVDDNNITNYNKKFIVPRFGYSNSSFESTFFE